MKKLMVGLGAVAVVLPLISSAAYFSAGTAVDIGAAQKVNDNTYVAGNNVTVSAPVAGDLFAAGSSVFVSSKVGGDIMAAGNTVVLTNVSAEDVRVAGNNITVGSTLGGELLAAAAQVTVTPDTKIAKDSYIRAGLVTFNGDEAGNLDVAAGSVVIAGTVEKNLKVVATKDLTIAAGAVIKGNLEYTAPVMATIADGAKIMGTTTFHEAQAPAAKNQTSWAGPFATIISFWFIAKLLMTLLVAYLLWYVFRRDAVAMVEESTRRFGWSLLRGFIFLVALPIAAIIALITVVGIPLGVVALLAYVALIMLTCPVAALMASSLLMKRRTDLRWYHIILGAVVLAVVGLIPFVGWIAYFIVWLASFGALLVVVGRKFKG